MLFDWRNSLLRDASRFDDDDDDDDDDIVVPVRILLPSVDDEGSDGNDNIEFDAREG